MTEITDMSASQFAHPITIRKSYRGVFRLITSPACALAVSLMGYYAFVFYVNKFMPESSLGVAIIRMTSLTILGLTFLFYANKRNGINPFFLFPLAIFVIAYTLRLTQNVYFDTVYLPFEGNRAFVVFFLGGLIPAFLLSQVAGAIRDDQFKVIMSCLALIFLLGVAVNWSELIESRYRYGYDVAARFTLSKVNPIPMSHTAFGFVLFYVIIFMKSRRNFVEAAIVVPLMLLVVLYAGSRAALAAGIITILVYILLLKGTRRIWVMLGVGISGLIIVINLRPDDLVVITTAFAKMFGLGHHQQDESTRLHILVWSGAFQQFLDNPAIGRYIIELTTGYYPHNIYLESLSGVGLLGSIPFFAHIALASRATYGVLRDPNSGIAVIFVALIFIRSSIAYASTLTVWGAEPYWISSALVIALWYGRKNKTAFSPNPPPLLSATKTNRYASVYQRVK